MKHKFLKDFSLVFISNCIGLILSVTMNLILPIVFRDSIASYGYIQLYLLYVSYYYIFDLGLCNGVYLREGGSDYNKLNFPVYSGQFRFLLLTQSFVAIIIAVLAVVLPMETSKIFLAVMVAINIVIMQAKTYVSLLLQATNRIKEYSLTVIICKLLNAIAVLAALLFGIRDYHLLIVLLTLGEVTSLVYALIECKEVIFTKPAQSKEVFQAIKENILSGINILISGAAAMLMLGFTRLAIEGKWGIETFAQISFTVSVSNLFMLFINAVSIVLYPKLRNVTSDRQVLLYDNMRDVLMGLMFVGLTVYYPLRAILVKLLPQYGTSIMYMAILLPICLYSSKISLLIQTYMKVLRMERKMMLINVGALVFSILLTVFAVYVIQDLTFAVITMLLAQAFRGIVSEIYLSKEMAIHPIKDIILELLLTAIFVISNWYVTGAAGTLFFVTSVIVYLLLKKNKIMKAVKELMHS